MTTLVLRDEVPVVDIPDTPGWSENYCFTAYDAKQDVGFWIHIGRCSYDSRIWREQLLIFMPGETYLVQRNFGVRPSTKGPSGAMLDLSCEAVGKSWQLQYHGPARTTTSAELNRGSLPEAGLHLLDLDVSFEGTSGIWDFGDSLKDEVWANLHYEQSGHFRGHISFDDTTVELNGVGHRDHSRGPRHQRSISGHCWLQGHFDEGSSFALFDLRMHQGGRDVQGVSMSAIFKDGRVYKATHQDPPFISSASETPGSYVLRLDSELGAMEIEAKIIRTLPLSVNDRNEGLFGVTIVPGWTELVAFEQPTEFVWNGRIGYGHTERTCHT